MAITQMYGFDSADPTLEGFSALSAVASFDSGTTPHGIGRSLKFAATSGSGGAITMPTSGSLDWRRINLYIEALPATTARAIIGSGAGVHIKLNTDGTLSFCQASSVLATSAALNTFEWYTVDWHVNSSTANLVRVRITHVSSEVLISELSSTNTSAFGAGIGPGDVTADTYTIYFDDYACDDAGWVARTPSFIRACRPASDNARAAKWTAGTTGTTNLWDAIDNTPPTGKVSPQTITSAITHAGGGAGNEDYDANTSNLPSFMPTGYVIALKIDIVHGEDISTGTKTLSYGLKSNPVYTHVAALNAGNDGGAVGAYPTTWTLRRDILQRPFILENTPCILSIRRPGTESRLADVCYADVEVLFCLTGKSPGPPCVTQVSRMRGALI